MSIMTLDGKSYKVESLDTRAQKLVSLIQFSEERINQLRNEVAISDTARIAYKRELDRSLAKA